jgi:hypothetical protein
VNVMTVGGSANGQLKIPASKYRPSDWICHVPPGT